mgnify:CR=1 FL=1
MQSQFTLIQLEEFEHAKEQFQRVISEKEIDMVQGNNKKAYRGLGIVEYCNGQYELALEQFEKALSIKQEEKLNTDLLLYQSSALELLPHPLFLIPLKQQIYLNKLKNLLKT